MAKSRYKKRADGRYQKRVAVGRDERGRAVYKTVYGATERELERKADEIRSEAQNENKRTTFRDWSEEWFVCYKANKAYNTQKQYRRMLDAYILPVLGDMELSAVKPLHVQSMINGLCSRGLSATAKTALLTARQIFEKALLNGLIEKPPVTGVEITAAAKCGKTALSGEARARVLAADTNVKYRAFLYTLFFTGLRRGEALALTRGDICLDAKIIKVNKTVIFAPNKAVVKNSPKSAAGIRSVVIADALGVVLKTHLPALETDVVFSGKDGGYMSLSAFRVFWDNILRETGLPKTVTPHTFRHNFATEIYYAGIDVKEAQRLLGHASASLTMEVYTHCKQTDKDVLAAKLNTINK